MAHENLYDSLSYNISIKDLCSDEKRWIVENIDSLDLEKRKLLYLLILHDYTKFNPNTKVVFPYKCKQISDEKIEIKLDALPIRTKRIIYKFIKLAQMSAKEKEMYTPTPYLEKN